MSPSQFPVASPLLFCALAGLAGCPNREVSRVEPNPEKEEFKNIGIKINRDLDILFVIDNSNSMAEEQTSLVQNFPKFVRVLSNIEGGLPNIHIGVVSSNMGALNVPGVERCAGLGHNGALLKGSTGDQSCGIAGKFIKSIEDTNNPGARITNLGDSSEATLATAFSCAATLGTGGCGFEQHLESMRTALTNPANAGFLRPTAKLAVVIVADEDDCSAKDAGFWGPASEALGPTGNFRCFEFGTECDGPADVRAPGTRNNCAPISRSPYMYARDEMLSRYVDFLKATKPPGNVLVAGVIGDSTPVEIGQDDNGTPTIEASCDYPIPSGPPGAKQYARPGVRLRYFLEQFPERNVVTTICDDDLSEPLEQIAKLFASAIDDSCIRGVPTQPVSCVATYITNPGRPNEVEVRLPQCDSATGAPSIEPCWRLVADAEKCSEYPSKLAVEIYQSQEPEEEASAHVWCATE